MINEALARAVVRRKSKEFLSFEKLKNAPEIKPGKGAALYVHIPFCRTLCNYCSFTRFRYSKKQAEKYFRSLEKEISIYHDKGFRFQTAYIGGGTPTISMSHLSRIIGLLKRKGVKEISVETNISDLTSKNIAILKNLGVSRVSVGVQTFEEKSLAAMGRKGLSLRKAKKILKDAENSFGTVNIDMIFNYQSQNKEMLSKDIETIKSVGARQVTFYPLMPSKNYKLEKELYSLILEEMKDFNAVTPWCFTKDASGINEYFVDNENYVGVGSGAISFLEGTLYANTFSLEKYGESLAKNMLPIAVAKKIKPDDLADYNLFIKLFGTRIRKKYVKEISARIFFLKTVGLLRKQGEDYVLTGKGMNLVSAMAQEFFEGLNLLRKHCSKNKI